MDREREPRSMGGMVARPNSTGVLTFPGDADEDDQLWTMEPALVKRKYELLCKLHGRLQDLLAKSQEQPTVAPANGSAERRRASNAKPARRRRPRKKPDGSSDSEQSLEEPPVNAWASEQALTVDSHHLVKGAGILKLLLDREAGFGWGANFRFEDVGSRRRSWTSVLQGWSCVENRFQGAGVRLEQELYSSWIPTWSAYSSNVAVVQPAGRPEHDVQKVLDVRFHPLGLPQLVCGCNAAPNELLLYDLTSGSSRPLAGHNCQVQAVEYASEGSLVVSCANNVVKVWDSSTAACLFTLGPGSDDSNSAGHRRKITAMTVNPTQSCLVATSGGRGDMQLLLWNVSRGTLVSELNAASRHERQLAPMDALEFCNDNLLICGSDATDGDPAVVQIWDVDACKECALFPAHSTYVTCLKTNPAGTVFATGSGDGTVGLFDMRSYGAIGRLPLGTKCEVTSVCFSSCGRYIAASSTANNSVVWDTRLMSMSSERAPPDSPPALAQATRALHSLSHGKPMPTTENPSQRAGFVDVGDQGVNDARWFRNSPVLVTGSGSGSIALWDVTLGRPCIRHIQSHTRCINTVSVSPEDLYVCSGGDDQKLVLYENALASRSRRWRLTHPLYKDRGLGL